MGSLCRGARVSDSEDEQSDTNQIQSPGTFSFLQECLRDTPLFAGVDPACADMIIEELTPQLVRKRLGIGELLIVQGGKGDAMYIIESGAMELFRGGGDTGEPEKFITSLNRGQYIGVQAVLYKMPRSASVRATKECVVWSLNLELYNEYTQMKLQYERRRAEKIASELRELFEPYQHLDDHQIANISNAFCKCEFQPNDEIYTKDSSEDFFIIAEGEVDFTRDIDFTADTPFDLGVTLGGLDFSGRGSGMGSGFDLGSAVRLGSGVGSGFNLELGREDSAISTKRTVGSGYFVQGLSLNAMTPTVDEPVKIDDDSEIRDVNDFQKFQFAENHKVIGDSAPASTRKGSSMMTKETSVMSSRASNFSGTVFSQGAGFYWCSQLPHYVNTDTSATLDSIVAKTKVILYKLAAIDVKHLIVPYICPDLSSDQISIERDNFWKPILEGNSLSDFITIGVLGNGSFGAVTMIQDPKTHDTYACKKMFKDRIMETDMQQKVLKAKRIMQSLDSPFIITLCATFQTETALCFIMEVALGGEFWCLLDRIGRIPESDARFYAGNIVLALEELHSKDFLYRDLKPENLVLNERGYLMITDFDTTKKRDNEVSLCGTREYMAPEMLWQWAQGFGVDWWGLGITMYEMIFGHTPFRDTPDAPAHVKILNDNIEFPHNHSLSKGGCAFITHLLEKIPYRRLGHRGADEVRDHIFFGSHSGFDPLDWDLLEQQTIPAPHIPQLDGNADLQNFTKPDVVFDEEVYSRLRHSSDFYRWADEF